MQDIETESLWSQISGTAIMGSMENSVLELIPSTVTTFAEFKITYPNGQLLKKDTKGLPNSHYESYFRDRTKLGIFGRVDNFSRLDGKVMVIGIRNEMNQIAITKKLLKKKKYQLIKDFKPPIIVTFDSETLTYGVFSLEEFESDLDNFKFENNSIIIKDTEKTWDFKTGKNLSGGQKALISLPYTTAYWFAWTSFFPETRLKK